MKQICFVNNLLNDMDNMNMVILMPCVKLNKMI